MVASDLLLSGTFGVSLYVRMEKATAVAHVLQGCHGANGDLKRVALAHLGTFEVGLKQGAHQSITWTAVLENEEMGPEGKHVDNERNDDQADNSETNVRDQRCLLNVSKGSRN